ncbi:GntR family transcriptional regulator [Peribacillus frigoritolerans]|nr:GntR family transcriptional regulator [Peribacillus frigoritolerans]
MARRPFNEDDIAQQFNCSRTPVREAIGKLENLLQVKPCP